MSGEHTGEPGREAGADDDRHVVAPGHLVELEQRAHLVDAVGDGHDGHTVTDEPSGHLGVRVARCREDHHVDVAGLSHDRRTLFAERCDHALGALVVDIRDEHELDGVRRHQLTGRPGADRASTDERYSHDRSTQVGAGELAPPAALRR